MRQFTLINGNGQRYSLNREEHFLNSPKNLGAKFASSYEQFDSDFIRTNRKPRPDDIRGNVIFTQNPYEEYTAFIRFIAVEPLTLEYVTNDTYLVSVDLKEISKTEIEDGYLKCDLRLKRLSRWYRLVTFLNDDGEKNDGKTYDYTYPYRYTEFEPETITIDSDSGYDSPTRIVIHGPCINPHWTHYLDGQIIEEGRLNATIISGRRLEIDCINIPYSIMELSNDRAISNNMYEYSDFSTERFFHLKYGRNRITVEHEGPNKLTLAVEARIEYETV